MQVFFLTLPDLNSLIKIYLIERLTIKMYKSIQHRCYLKGTPVGMGKGVD